jgi:hypothetical protein
LCRKQFYRYLQVLFNKPSYGILLFKIVLGVVLCMPAMALAQQEPADSIVNPSADPAARIY